MGQFISKTLIPKSWSWLSRFLLRQHADDALRVTQPALPEAPSKKSPKYQTLVEKMLAQGRTALLLRPQIAANLSADDLRLAQEQLDDDMAIVPQGVVGVRPRCYETLDDDMAAKAERIINVEGFFLDRFAVTNQRYSEFLADGGYEQMSLWDESIWPAVLGFVDRTGHPGPRFWENGTYSESLAKHPVVGVSWYEANAYARWAGQRLPTDPEWIKAGAWPVTVDGERPIQRRFPWGEALDRRRVNISGSGHDATLPVDALSEGASVGNVHQLIGNVWEWTSSAFGVWEPAGRKIETTQPLKSIRGGAFDTYFEAQAHCQFQSGEAPLSRKHNIGFRCALGFCDILQGDEAQSTDSTRSDNALEAHA